MKIAWGTFALIIFLFCALGVPAQEGENQNPPGDQDVPPDMSWDSFTQSLRQQTPTLWDLLNQEAAVYAVVPHTRISQTVAYLEATIYLRDGSQLNYRWHEIITAEDVRAKGTDSKLKDFADVVKALHKEALEWQSKGILATREQVSVPWTQEEIAIWKATGSVVRNVLTDQVGGFLSPYRNAQPREVWAGLLLKNGKKYIGLATSTVNNSGMKNYHVFKSYPLEDLAGPKAAEILFEIQHDILVIRKQDGYSIIPGLNKVRTTRPPVPHRRCFFATMNGRITIVRTGIILE